MTADDLDRFALERRAADDAYNQALTELDRALVATSDRPVAREGTR